MATKKTKKAVTEVVLNGKQLDAAIIDKALELSENKFKPEDFEMFMAAINAKCLEGNKDRIESYMKHRDYNKLGLTIMNAIVAKLEQWSYDEAAGLYNSTLGGGDNE
jgi:hypothetical protein